MATLQIELEGMAGASWWAGALDMTNDLPGQGHMTPPVSELEDRLLRAAEPAAFSDAELEGLPEPVRRHLTLAISPKTPLATSARLRMRGTIKLGRWLPFRARQVLDPHHGLVWAARVAGVIAGSDRYAEQWTTMAAALPARPKQPRRSRRLVSPYAGSGSRLGGRRSP